MTNRKYTKYVVAALLVFLAIPFIFLNLSFNNNDDQLMLFLSSGLMRIPDAGNVILIHHLWGQFIAALYAHYTFSFNLYSVLLYITLYALFIYISVLLFNKIKLRSFVLSAVILFLIVAGLFFYFFMEVEFTSVSILLVMAVLLSQIIHKEGHLLPLLLIFTAAILWRKESGFIYFLFVWSLFLIPDINKKKLIKFILFSGGIFILLYLSEYLHSSYFDFHTFQKIEALDKLCARPTYRTDPANQNLAAENLIKSWFCADPLFLNTSFLTDTAKWYVYHSDIKLIFTNLLRLIADERFSIILFSITLLFCLLKPSKYTKYLLLNTFVIFILVFYLIIFKRTPKRLILPLFTLFSVIQIFIFFSVTAKATTRRLFIILLALVLSYKFFCLIKLSNLHEQQHQEFDRITAYINAHPDKLFIANPISMKLHFMNTLTNTEDLLPHKNVIVYGWISLSPDYNRMLAYYGLNNLTHDVEKRKDILFINDDLFFETNYCQFLYEQYHVKVHFIDYPSENTPVKIRKLVTAL